MSTTQAQEEASRRNQENVVKDGGPDDPVEAALQQAADEADQTDSTVDDENADSLEKEPIRSVLETIRYKLDAEERQHIDQLAQRRLEALDKEFQTQASAKKRSQGFPWPFGGYDKRVEKVHKQHRESIKKLEQRRADVRDFAAQSAQILHNQTANVEESLSELREAFHKHPESKAFTKKVDDYAAKEGISESAALANVVNASAPTDVLDSWIRLADQNTASGQRLKKAYENAVGNMAEFENAANVFHTAVNSLGTAGMNSKDLKNISQSLLKDADDRFQKAASDVKMPGQSGKGSFLDEMHESMNNIVNYFQELLKSFAKVVGVSSKPSQ